MTSKISPGGMSVSLPRKSVMIHPGIGNTTGGVRLGIQIDGLSMGGDETVGCRVDGNAVGSNETTGSHVGRGRRNGGTGESVGLLDGTFDGISVVGTGTRTGVTVVSAGATVVGTGAGVVGTGDGVVGTGVGVETEAGEHSDSKFPLQ